MECPPSLYFDPTINVCNYPELVDCKQPTSTTKKSPTSTTTAFPATTTTKLPTNTTALPVSTSSTDDIININSTTIELINKMHLEEIATNTTHSVNQTTATEEPSFNTTMMETTTMEPTDNTTTTEPITTSTSPVIQCPESTDGFPVYLAHPTDCTKFYECHDEEPILMECAPPLYFDPRIDVCNYPELVDCKMP